MSRTAVDMALIESFVQGSKSSALQGLNEGALAAFRSSGLPTTRDEDWKYTNLEGLARISNDSLAGSVTTDPLPRQVTPPQDIDAHWLTISDGVIDDDRVREVNAALDGKAEIYRLSSRDEGAGLLLDNAVASFNGALIRDALCLRVLRDTNVDLPIGILLDDLTGDESGTSHVRLIIDIEENARAELIELHRSSGSSEHYATLISEVDLATGAKLGYVKIQERDENHSQLGQVHARCGKDASFEFASVDVGGKLIRNDITAAIHSAGAHFGSAGLGLTADGQHVDNHIAADHQVGPATSAQNYRYIASGRSRCVFNGKAIVREGADGTDAEQSNHSLLLSEKAEIDTKPELEIYAEDVKCAHGATVGQLDDKALFYLRSRGLDREQAAQLLTRAFANAVLEDVPVESAREYLGEVVDRKLDQLVEENGA